MPTVMETNGRDAYFGKSSSSLYASHITPAATENSMHSLSSTSAGVKPERVYTGIGLSGGVAIGRPYIYQPPAIVGTDAKPASVPAEAERTRTALFKVAEYYSNLAQQADRQLSQSAGDIFRAHSMLAADPSLMAALESKLAAGYANAEAAVSETFDNFAGELRTAASEIFKERANDIAEFKHSVLMYLASKCGAGDDEDSFYSRFGDGHDGQDHILLAVHFVPGATMSATRHTRGFVVKKGGPSSHAAILARMMGLPAVSGVPDITSGLSRDSTILVDGDMGRVCIDPSQETLSYYNKQRPRRATMNRAAVPPVKGFKVLADLDRTEDLPQVLAAQAEGIGLYRTESEVLINQRMLTEDEQVERYTRLIDSVPGQPVYVRLFDFGADKAADWLHLPSEDNPALGCRGARLLLAEPALLRDQARALARASCRSGIRVIYPMVHGLDQFLKLRESFEAAISDIPNAQLSHGVMFEVPGACLEARAFFKHADFGRIGTNDLTQYLFAADRMNDTISQDELFDQPALWTLIENVVRAAAVAGKGLSICGELVSEPKYIGRLLRVGISEISVSPQHIARLRREAGRLLENPEGFCCSSEGQYSFLTS